MASIVSNYFAFMLGTPQREVAYTTTLLRDATHNWWTMDLCKWGEKMPLDRATFYLALLNRFGNKLWAKLGLGNIVNLIQGSKLVREYAAEFELNIGRLDCSNKAILMQFFIWGLHRDISERVSIMHPTSLLQAIASVEENELAIKFSCKPPCGSAMLLTFFPLQLVAISVVASRVDSSTWVSWMLLLCLLAQRRRRLDC